MDYKIIVRKIVDLPWQTLDQEKLHALMFLSAHAAQEFAASLRIALRHFSWHEGLKKMATGELQTDNMRFGSYQESGDHADFLWHFVHECNLHLAVSEKIFNTGEAYLGQVEKLPEMVRAMSIFSREHEMSLVYKNILQAPAWNTPALQAYRHYLERHVELDSEKGGHDELVADLPVTDAVADFYRLRLDMYQCIFPDLIVPQRKTASHIACAE